MVLIEETDSEEMIEEVLGGSVEDALFERGYVERGFFVTSVLENDGQGTTVMVPDGDWLGERAREALKEVCGGELRRAAS